MEKDIKGISGGAPTPERPVPQVTIPSPEDYALPEVGISDEVQDPHMWSSVIQAATPHQNVIEVQEFHGSGPLGVAAAMSSDKVSHEIVKHAKECKGPVSCIAIYALADVVNKKLL